MRINNNYIFL